MPAPQPITVTQSATNPAAPRAPYPYVIVGTLPTAAIAAATTGARGTVLRAAAVPDLGAQTVTDIATAQTAINNIVAKINAFLAANRTAGQLA